MRLVYTKNANEIEGRDCDADWASDLDKRSSTTGYVFKFQGTAISWATKRQKTIASVIDRIRVHVYGFSNQRGSLV